MDRFPMLTTYKTLLNGVAILIVVLGLFVAIDTARVRVWGETRFEFDTFLLTFIPFGIGAFILAVTAELVTLFLTIEERLYQIQYNTTPRPSQTDSQTASLGPGSSAPQTAQPTDISRETAPPAVSQATGPKVRATVTAEDRTVVYQRPNKMSPPHRILVFGEDVTLVARTADCAWLKVDASYEGWIYSADLRLHGDFYDLPIVSE